MLVGMNNESILKYNRELILFHLYRLHGAGIAELAKLTEISVPAVSRLIKGLKDENLVYIENRKNGGRGHSAGSVKLNEPFSHVICLDIRPYEICSVLSTIYGEVAGDLRKTPIRLTTPEALIDSIAKEISYYLDKGKQEHLELKAVAIACHGQVDTENGVSLVMPQAPWHEALYLKFLLEQRLPIKVALDNDCVMRALAQKWSILKRHGQCHDFCVINVDYGIGSSFLINNEIYRGLLFGSGQIGHTIIDPHGRLCSCGRIGCLETVASKGAILNAVNEYLQALNGNNESLDFSQIAKLYLEKDHRITSLIDRIAICLGRSIYNFLNLININHIYIYGCACEFGDDFLNLIKKQITLNPFDKQEQIRELSTSIEYGTLTEAEQIAGICYLYGEKLYHL